MFKAVGGKSRQIPPRTAIELPGPTPMATMLPEIGVHLGNIGLMRLRVLSVPGRTYQHNPYFGAFCEGLEEAGMDVVDLHSLAAKTFRFDILHIHFPEHYVTERSVAWALVHGISFLSYALMAKLLGKKIVRTVHEVLPSRRHTWLLWPYLWCIDALTDAYVFMNRESERQFWGALSRAARTVSHVPHGSYQIPSMGKTRREELRREVTGGIDCILVGFLGEIKPYKNIDTLAYLPVEDSTGRPTKFLVAGLIHRDCQPSIVEALLARIAPGRLIRFAERPSDDRMIELMQVIDVALLPYKHGWNSGAAILALSCRCRILCSALPMFRELAERLGAPWVYTYNHEAEDLVAELRTTLTRLIQNKVDAHALDRLQAFIADTSFTEGAKRLCNLYTHLMAVGRNNQERAGRHN